MENFTESVQTESGLTGVPSPAPPQVKAWLAGGHDATKVAVITGATGGIGAAIAKSLSRAGYSLVLNAPSNEGLNALVSRLHGPAVAVPGNLRVESMPGTLLAAALRNFGRCDVCFNNGGLLEAGTIDTIDIERVC